jgi:hypothetical protein
MKRIPVTVFVVGAAPATAELNQQTAKTLK